MSCQNCEYEGVCAAPDYCARWDCPSRYACGNCPQGCIEGIARLEKAECKECGAETIVDPSGPVKCPMCKHEGG